MKIKLVLKLFVVANKSVVLKLSLYVLNPPTHFDERISGI